MAALTTLLVFFLVLPLLTFYRQSQELVGQGKKIKAVLKQKDFAKVKVELKTSQDQLETTTASYNKLSWLGVIPVAKGYYSDGAHLLTAGDKAITAVTVMIKAVEPYQDFLGLDAQTKGPDKTTEDRISFLVETISEVNSHFGSGRKKCRGCPVRNSPNKPQPLSGNI